MSAPAWWGHLAQRLGPWSAEPRWRYLAFHSAAAAFVWLVLRAVLRGVDDLTLAEIAAFGYTVAEKAVDHAMEPTVWGTRWQEVRDIACDLWAAGAVAFLTLARTIPVHWAWMPVVVWVIGFAAFAWWSRP